MALTREQLKKRSKKRSKSQPMELASGGEVLVLQKSPIWGASIAEKLAKISKQVEGASGKVTPELLMLQAKAIRECIADCLVDSKCHHLFESADDPVLLEMAEEDFDSLIELFKASLAANGLSNHLADEGGDAKK